MPDFPISLSATRGLALAQAAESMLRTMGGGEVVFRLPASAQPDNATQQELGLEAALTDEVVVSPVIVREKADAVELLVSPKSLSLQLLLHGLRAEQLFEMAISVNVQGRELRIESYCAEVFAERVYLYRVSAVE